MTKRAIKRSGLPRTWVVSWRERKTGSHHRLTFSDTRTPARNRKALAAAKEAAAERVPEARYGRVWIAEHEDWPGRGYRIRYKVTRAGVKRHTRLPKEWLPEKVSRKAKKVTPKVEAGTRSTSPPRRSPVSSTKGTVAAAPLPLPGEVLVGAGLAHLLST